MFSQYYIYERINSKKTIMQYYLRKIAPLSLRVSTIILCALKVLQPGHFGASARAHQCRKQAFWKYRGIYRISGFFRNGTHKISSPFIFPPEFPVFIGVLGGEGCNSTLHHPSSPFIILLIRGIREFLFTFPLLRFLCFQLNLICV